MFPPYSNNGLHVDFFTEQLLSCLHFQRKSQVSKKGLPSVSHLVRRVCQPLAGEMERHSQTSDLLRGFEEQVTLYLENFIYGMKDRKGLICNKEVIFFIYSVSLGFCPFSTFYNDSVLVQT